MMNLLEKLNKAAKREQLLAWLQIVLVCVIGAAAYPTFLDPGKIAPGGLTGVAMILKHLWGWDIGITSLILNIPLFLLGLKKQGWKFTIYAIYSVCIYSACAWLITDVLPIDVSMASPLAGTRSHTCRCMWPSRRRKAA